MCVGVTQRQAIEKRDCQLFPGQIIEIVSEKSDEKMAPVGERRKKKREKSSTEEREEKEKLWSVFRSSTQARDTSRHTEGACPLKIC